MKKLFLLLITATLFLSACGKTVEVDLTTDEIKSVKSEISQLKDYISSYKSKNGEIPNLKIVELARAYEDIGEIGKAIRVYKDVLDDGFKTRAIINNLGKLYEKSEEYDKAIEMYQLMIDEYFEMRYLRDIVWAHIYAGNRKEAEKYFNAWQLEFHKTDAHIQSEIKKMRKGEK